MRIFCVVLLGLSASACGAKTGEQACKDVADSLAVAFQQCGFDYQMSYDSFVQGLANGDCANIVGIRDEPALYDDCIPTLKALTCPQINDPTLKLPASCLGQLQRNE